MTLIPSAQCEALTKHWEECRLQAYPDPGTGGVPWTCGWGDTGPDIHPGTVWTQQEADYRFMLRMDQFGASVAGMVGPATTQNQFDALVCLAYNIGAPALHGSTLLRLHNAGDINGASAEFPKWDHAGGRVMQGLLNRRLSEQTLYLTKGI